MELNSNSGADIRKDIRVTFYVRGLRPVLVKINKNTDSLDNLKQIVGNRLGVQDFNKYWFYLDNGARVDWVSLIEQNDKILMEYSTNDLQQTIDEEKSNFDNPYQKPVDYYPPFDDQNGVRIYRGYPFHPVPPLFYPKFSQIGENKNQFNGSPKYEI